MNFTNMQMLGGAVMLAALIGGVVLFLRSRAPGKDEFDWDRLGDIDEKHYVEDRIDERLERVKSVDRMVWDILLEEKVKLVILVVLQVISAAITFWFWNKAGDGDAGKVIASAFFLFNLVVLPYALGKAASSLVAGVMSLGIILASFLASSGLASIATKGQERVSGSAEIDRQRIEKQILTREKTLLSIDKSRARGALVGDKKALETKISGVFNTQVKHTRNARRRNKSLKRGGTLDDLSSHCSDPWPVRNAGRLCKQIDGLKDEMAAIQKLIEALDSATRLRTEIVELTTRRDAKSDLAISDPLAPIRSVLPEAISDALGDLRSILIGIVGEIIFNGYAYLFMSDVNREARRRWVNARQRTFRTLVIDAGLPFEQRSTYKVAVIEDEPGKIGKPTIAPPNQMGSGDQSPAPAAQDIASPGEPEISQLLNQTEQLGRGEVVALRKLAGAGGHLSLGPVDLYLNTQLVDQPGNELQSIAVHGDYRDWCEGLGYQPLPYVDFTRGISALLVARLGVFAIDREMSNLRFGEQVTYRGVGLSQQARAVV